MDWLTNWDDLIHGTIVFGAMVPFFLALALAWKGLRPHAWVAFGLAPVASYLWLFGLPAFPPKSSDDVSLTGLLIASAACIPLVAKKRWVSVVMALALFTALAWSVYPAWLEDGGTASRKVLVAVGMGASITLVAVFAELAQRLPGTASRRCTLAAFIPPSIALSILLQLGGSARFGQAIGALSAALAALLLLQILRPKNPTENPTPDAGLAGIWGCLFLLLAWSGWLFAELRYGLAALLILAPVVCYATQWLPLPRGNRWLDVVWDGLASMIVSATIATIAISDYLEEMSEFEGY